MLIGTVSSIKFSFPYIAKRTYYVSRILSINNNGQYFKFVKIITLIIMNKNNNKK